MTNEKEYCGICQSELDAEGKCPSCGGGAGENTNENNRQQALVESAEPPKAKNKLLLRIVSTVIAIAVGTFAGKFLANQMMGTKTEKEYIADMDKFIAQMEEYEPGTIDDEVYTSKHWGLKFDCGNDWVMYNSSELSQLGADIRKDAVASSMAALENEDISQELRDKLEEAIYAESEMAASYIEDGQLVGQVMTGVFGMFGGSATPMDKYVAELEKKFKTVGTNVKSTKEDLAGREFDVIYVDMEQNGMTIKSKYYIERKDNVFCMITLQYLADYEDDVIEAFENATKKY